MAESSLSRVAVSKIGKVNPTTTWTVLISGVEHEVVLSKTWSHKVVVLYDGQIVLDKRFVTKPQDGCFASWVSDGITFAVQYNSTLANRFELYLKGLEFSQLPLGQGLKAPGMNRKKSQQNAKREPRTYVLRAVRSTPSGESLVLSNSRSPNHGSDTKTGGSPHTWVSPVDHGGEGEGCGFVGGRG